MIDIRRFALNRITCPALSLEEFFLLAADLGLSKVELRNDLPGGRIVDDMKPAQAAALAEKHGVRVITINALQKFNLASVKARVSLELEELLDTASALRCPAIVLCPNNDMKDTRDAATRLSETAAALSDFGPSFARRGILGYVEPLGFAECSLPSLVAAVTAITRSGHSCYRTVYDTFHHYLGPDTENDIGTSYDVSHTGLIHASGVESPIAKMKYRDEHRVLPGPSDRTFCREQIARHVKKGYSGDISLEPFAPEVQKLPQAKLVDALRASLEYLRA
ncbi:MAG: TIM barrel protein [Spirochaetes bacterium]|nr:TIM barrel protein [Spirochaetota bacterium]